MRLATARSPATACLIAAAVLITSALPLMTSAADQQLRDTRITDLEFARTRYVLASRAFGSEDRQRALAFIDEFELRSDALSNAQYLLGLLTVAAFARNGHDSCFPGANAWLPDSRLPLRLIWIPEGWVVVRAAPIQSDLVGACITRIEELMPEEMLEHLRVLGGGPDTSLTRDLMWVIENGGLLHALGIAESADGLAFEATLRDGRSVQRKVHFVPKSKLPGGVRPARLGSTEPYASEQELGWQQAVSAAQQPLYLQDGDQLFRARRIPELEALYVQFPSNFDEEGQSIAFLREVDDELANARLRHLIIDDRLNTGGDIDQTREWIRTLPSRMADRIYVLIGRYTFSAGIVAAAAVKHDGGSRVTLVGEEVGDRLRWWSEGEAVCMPGTDYCFHVATGLWDLVQGCAGEPACYGDRLDSTVDSLEPDLRAPLTASDWLAGRDPGLEAIERDLARR